MTSEERAEILSFLHANPMGVLSTINADNASSESALVAFAETDDFELIFQTLNDARKYKNLKHEHRISFVTGWEVEKTKQITLQYEGVARELEIDSDEYRKCRAIFEAKKTPCTSEFLDNPKSRLFIVKPIWLSYSDYSGAIPRIIEIKKADI